MKNENLDIELKKLIKRANQRILEIERKYGKDIWGINDVKKYLDTQVLQAWTKNDRISFKKSYSDEQKKAIKKIANKFLKSPRSSLKGIKNIINKQREGIEKLLKDNKIKSPHLSNRDLFDLHSFVEEKDFLDITRKDTLSDMILLFEEAHYKRYTLDKFLEEIKDYIEGDVINDLDMRDKLTRLYNKFVYVPPKKKKNQKRKLIKRKK